MAAKKTESLTAYEAECAAYEAKRASGEMSSTQVDIALSLLAEAQSTAMSDETDAKP